MRKKSFILSSSGLKNLVQNQSYGEDFKFIFGEHEIEMKNLFAEFVSPYVSQIHQSDPTINSIHFCNNNSNEHSKINYISQMSDEIFKLFESISQGGTIEIDNKQCFQLQIVSILLKNKEMFAKLDELFDKDDNEFSDEKVSEELEFLSFLEMSSESAKVWNRSKSIEYIASNFYLIDSKKIIDLPRTVFYSILTNDKLTIESEDSLLDVIEEFTNKEKRQKSINSSDDFLSDIYFYEEVNFDFLSEAKLKEFIEKVNPNEISSSLWDKIKKCFYVYMKRQNSPESAKREGNGFYRHRIQYAKNIVVGGLDNYIQLGEKPNSKSKANHPVIHPPVNSSLDPSSLLSFSVYGEHLVAVTRSGSLIVVGRNSDGRIFGSLEKTDISQFKEFSMNDSSGRPLAPVSAVCTRYSTLYMFTKSCGSGRQLVYCHCQINEGTPIFLDIGNHEPVSLFGGGSHTAAICTDGEVIFINGDSLRNQPSSPIPASSLPGGEKATMVAFLNNSVLALSSSGRVFASDFESGSCVLNFSEVSELSDKQIVWLSGTENHCFAVTSEGRVFGRGSNGDGRLGFGEGTSSVPSFTEISSLSSYKIRAAYAGSCHSLFETREGKILACGWTYYCQLLNCSS